VALKCPEASSLATYVWTLRLFWTPDSDLCLICW